MRVTTAARVYGGRGNNRMAAVVRADYIRQAEENGEKRMILLPPWERAYAVTVTLRGLAALRLPWGECALYQPVVHTLHLNSSGMSPLEQCRQHGSHKRGNR